MNELLSRMFCRHHYTTRYIFEGVRNNKRGIIFVNECIKCQKIKDSFEEKQRVKYDG